MCAPPPRERKVSVGWRLRINNGKHEGVEERTWDSGIGDAGPADEARRGKPTRETSSSAPDRTIYGGRCRDLIGQPECGLEVLIGWEPRARARTVFPERSEVADARVP